jgi:hypothetical protein
MYLWYNKPRTNDHCCPLDLEITNHWCNHRTAYCFLSVYLLLRSLLLIRVSHEMEVTQGLHEIVTMHVVLVVHRPQNDVCLCNSNAYYDSLVSQEEIGDCLSCLSRESCLHHKA